MVPHLTKLWDLVTNERVIERRWFQESSICTGTANQGNHYRCSDPSGGAVYSAVAYTV